jgi:hypothetical protein
MKTGRKGRSNETETETKYGCERTSNRGWMGHLPAQRRISREPGKDRATASYVAARRRIDTDANQGTDCEAAKSTQ